MFKPTWLPAYTFVLALPIASIGCHESDGQNASNPVGENTKADDKLAKGIRDGSPNNDGDEYTVNDANVSGDILTLDVQYGGGCEDHEFELFWDGWFVGNDPTQAELTLWHDAHGDGCEQVITESLSFDLAAVKLQASRLEEPIVLNIGDISVTYAFGDSKPPVLKPLREGDSDGIGDKYTVNDLSISGDILTLDVQYGGGCEDHEFELFWDGWFVGNDPTQAELTLWHDAHGDGCEQVITESLSFDLADLKLQASRLEGPIVLNIDQGGGSVEYNLD